MKAKVALTLHPFAVPSSATVAPFACVPVAPAPKGAPVAPQAPAPWGGSEPPQYFTVPLHELDSETLDRLCREFRDEVFRKAGKEQPPEQAVTAPAPLTDDYIERHIGPDEGDRAAVTAIVREVEKAHGIGG